jgi:hypothetical protein
MLSKNNRVEANDFPHKDLLLIEAKALKSTLHDLRKRLEKIATEINHNQTDHAHHEETVSTANENENGNMDQQEVTIGEEQPQATSPPVTIPIRNNSYERLKRSSVAIVGDMQNKGLQIADTLVKCGIRKLILFDNKDCIQLVEHENLRWESEENPLFELESYVANYEVNEESFDHFLDRLERGGDEENPIDIVIVPGDVDMESEQYNLIVRAAQSVGCPLISSANSVDDSPVLTIHQPTGDVVKITDRTTINMIALEMLLS